EIGFVEIGASDVDAVPGKDPREVLNFGGTRRGREAVQVEDHLQQPLAAGTATAFDQAVTIRVVVVGQFFTAANRSRRADPDHALLDVDVAVGPARVVDVARDVAADARVDHRSVGELETPDMPVADIPALSLEAFLIRDFLASVMDDPFVLRNAGCGKHAPAV